MFDPVISPLYRFLSVFFSKENFQCKLKKKVYTIWSYEFEWQYSHDEG